MSDARVLAWAVARNWPVLTRDHKDFADFHDLVIAVGGHHPGILVVRFDNAPQHNLTELRDCDGNYKPGVVGGWSHGWGSRLESLALIVDSWQTIAPAP